jgi:hypothetical protein
MKPKEHWIPFQGDLGEENPFDFNLARTSMQRAIQMAWLDIPLEARSLARLDVALSLLLKELMNEVRQDAARHNIE